MVMRYAHLQPEVNAKAINAAMSFYPASIQADTKRTPKRTSAEVRLAKGA